MNSSTNHRIVSFIKTVLLKVLNTRWVKIHYLILDINPYELARRMEEFNLTVKELAYEDFFKGDSLYFNEKKMLFYKNRFRDCTYKAYGIMIDGILVYSSWISTHRLGMGFSLKNKDFYLCSNEGYLEDDYCHPNFRGNGFHTQMIAYRINELYKIGKTRIVVTVADGNTPALKALLKNNFQDVGTFYVGKILGRRFVTLNKKKYEQ